MHDLKTTTSADPVDDFELGILLGSRRAFASVAGRCSAADAECMRRVRDQKLYLGRAETWEEFCPKFLGVSKSQANRVIRCLEEFGPDYFELTQLTRVSPEQYRAIAPAVREKRIQVNGEAIALLPENTERIASAVAELRATAANAQAAPAPSPGTQMTVFERRFDRLIEDFAEFSRSPMSPAERSQVDSVRSKAEGALKRLGLERGRP